MKIKPAEKNGGVVLELGPQETQLPPLDLGASAAVLPAFSLKKILVPVDFSERTGKALQYAVPLAIQFDAEITLLHVIEAPYLPPSEVGGVTELESVDESREELESLQTEVAGMARCKTLLRKGSAHYEILDAAQELGSNLIILSTHGRTGLARIILGSTAEYVVRHASCPLLIVREKEQEFVRPVAAGQFSGESSNEADFEVEMRSGL